MLSKENDPDWWKEEDETGNRLMKVQRKQTQGSHRAVEGCERASRKRGWEGKEKKDNENENNWQAKVLKIRERGVSQRQGSSEPQTLDTQTQLIIKLSIMNKK